ncbi:superoxide dismutase[Cu-Zn] [Gluconobacter kondonii]|uniref:superoxide dismutase[Cu-Zn] n=1 Tax=Gluconobacter kondonii TaxID=941463 RepID=UPI001B8B25A3|nr:superoxide dismutase family protein [Gluconobacter kondonii]MBS1052115.1 superoxide dismutase family protein [Gluconobacter kondonii]MBS1055369.1 superoxide dismutase family protein [Gluconobacter kondonii]
MRRSGFLTLLLASAIAIPSLACAADSVSGELKGTDGASHGIVTVTDAPKGVLLRLQVQGLTPGWHGIHFHEKGNCAAPKFTSAGAHVHSTTPVVHGLLKADANDAGDLPNLYVAPDGTATVELYSTLVSLKGGKALPALMDADGASVVVHAKPDDYQTQPIGGSGDRVACAVLH